MMITYASIQALTMVKNVLKKNALSPPNTALESDQRARHIGKFSIIALYAKLSFGITMVVGKEA